MTGLERLRDLVDHMGERETAHDHPKDVSMSAYDLLPECDRKAISLALDCGGVEEIKKRLMPEGMSWPVFEDGEPVRIGDKFECWCGEEHVVGSVSFRGSCAVLNMSHAHTFVVGHGPETVHGKRVKRPESRERLEDDATMPAATYCERMGIEVEEGCSFVEPMARDLVRRCKELSRKENNNE